MQPLWKKVARLFKEALFTSPSKEMTAVNRELAQGIRTSKISDWRVVILEQNLMPESFSSRQQHYSTSYHTLWPSGYN